MVKASFHLSRALQDTHINTLAHICRRWYGPVLPQPDHRPRQAPLAPITLITSRALLRFWLTLVCSGKHQHETESLLEKYELDQHRTSVQPLNLQHLTSIPLFLECHLRTWQCRPSDIQKQHRADVSVICLRVPQRFWRMIKKKSSVISCISLSFQGREKNKNNGHAEPDLRTPWQTHKKC